MYSARKKYRTAIQVHGRELPVEVVMERRPNTRFSITRRSVTLRMPSGQPQAFVQEQLAALQSWVEKQAAQKPALLAAFFGKTYKTGDLLQVGARKYWLEITPTTRATHTARLIGDTICLEISTIAGEAQVGKSIKTLLSRVVAGDYHLEISERVHAINRRTFNRPVKNIYLKYNHSNWGSCSHNGNVNLSTRLLFAPRDVQDYVIIHELAHLLEMNHSGRFWALIAAFMPEYAEKEQWLKANGGSCDF